MWTDLSGVPDDTALAAWAAADKRYQSLRGLGVLTPKETQRPQSSEVMEGASGVGPEARKRPTPAQGCASA